MSVVILNRCQCGNWKSARAKQCRSCYRIYKQLTTRRESAYERNHDTCPECGEVKSKKAKLCWSCYKASLPKPDITCPTCGKEKHPRAKQCIVCRMKYNPPRVIWTDEMKAKARANRAKKPLTEQWYAPTSCGRKR